MISSLHDRCVMSSVTLQSRQRDNTGSFADGEDIDTLATNALDAARKMAPGMERNAALKQASLLRVKADAGRLLLARRGRPPKSY
jgi:hypothetical protein